MLSAVSCQAPDCHPRRNVALATWQKTLTCSVAMALMSLRFVAAVSSRSREASSGGGTPPLQQHTRRPLRSESAPFGWHFQRSPRCCCGSVLAGPRRRMGNPRRRTGTDASAPKAKASYQPGSLGRRAEETDAYGPSPSQRSTARFKGCWRADSGAAGKAQVDERS